MSSDATVRVNYEQTEVYEQFVDEYGVFNSYQDFFVFAAAVGFANNKKADPGSGNEMLWMHFTDKNLYKATAAAIAYNDLKEPEALINPEKQLSILAKFQAGGTDILEEKLGDIEGDPTDAILNHIKEQQDVDEDEDEDEDTQTVIEKILESFDNDMYADNE